MINKKNVLAGWLIGYFVVFSPMDMMQTFSPIEALTSAIVGVAGAIIILGVLK